jgi:phosphatidylserine/phosphatidylglycerophosphate/cardiolipin synthase-like enzyme
MSTQATASVIDENGAALSAQLTAKLTDISGLFDNDLGTVKFNNGSISIGPYDADALAGEFGPRKLRLSIFNGTRSLMSPISQKLWEKDDVSDSVMNFGQMKIAQRDASGWAVTLGLPATQPLPYLSQGNAVRILVDSEEAWGYIADRLGAAATEVDILQLELDVPKHDEPGIVLKFSPALDASNLRSVQSTDTLLESQLQQLATKNVVVRIMMDDGSWKNILVIIGEALLLLLAFPITLIMAIINYKALAFAIGKGVSYLFHSHPDGGVGDLAKYFSTAPAPTVLGFKRTLWNRIHAKVLMLDQKEVILIGTPFVQSYFDTSTHAIDEPRRGWHPDIPLHEVSMGVRGPGVNDVSETYRLHWNQAKGSEDMKAIPPVPVATAGPDEYPASLQLIRTLNGGVFPAPLANGEQGVLEAYLRAIENATDFIYFEDQYFTNDTIAKALIAALQAKPALTAILAVNVIPDIPLYAPWQCALIKEIRSKLGTDASRIGFFTLWSQEAGKIMPNYIEAKVGIVGNDWATIGSANLDGASLDYFQIFHALQFGSNRNHELNYIIFNDINGQPQTGAVEALRRRLWSEHLGYADPNSSDLNMTGSNDGSRFLALWRNSSQAKVNLLKSSPGGAPPAGTGRVIEYPSKPTWDYKTYLTSSGITVDGKTLTLVEESRPFSFKQGNWIS